MIGILNLFTVEKLGYSQRINKFYDFLNGIFFLNGHEPNELFGLV
jgi:hypothetical protein